MAGTSKYSVFLTRKGVVRAMILVKKPEYLKIPPTQPRKGSQGEAEAVEQFVGV